MCTIISALEVYTLNAPALCGQKGRGWYYWCIIKGLERVPHKRSLRNVPKLITYMLLLLLVE